MVRKCQVRPSIKRLQGNRWSTHTTGHERRRSPRQRLHPRASLSSNMHRGPHAALRGQRDPVQPHPKIWAEDHHIHAQAVTSIRHYRKVFWKFPYPLTA
jgi:hypothetical protein